MVECRCSSVNVRKIKSRINHNFAFHTAVNSKANNNVKLTINLHTLKHISIVHVKQPLITHARRLISFLRQPKISWSVRKSRFSEE